MPATSFRLTPTFDWTRPPAAVPPPRPISRRDKERVARLLAGQKPRRKKAPRVVVNVGARTVYIDRIEAAIGAGQIDAIPDNQPVTSLEITTGELALLLQILFPEDWPELVPVLEATHTPPGSAERIAVYTQRVEQGEELYHRADACPIRGDVDGRLVAAGKLALAIRQRANGSGPRVVGWAC